MDDAGRQVWTSLEIVKLVAGLLVPAALAFLGVYFHRMTKRFEQLQWRNQRLIDKRIAIYDSLAPELNDLLCYFTFVGLWKELTPPEVVARKRRIDKQIYLAAPMMSPTFFVAASTFMNLCYATFQGWGRDPRLRTSFDKRKSAAGEQWRPEWERLCFTHDVVDAGEVRRAYQEIMNVFAIDIGLEGMHAAPVGHYPTQG